MEQQLNEISQLKNKMTAVEFKSIETNRTIQQISANQLITGGRGEEAPTASAQTSQLSINVAGLDQELKLIKGQLLEERQKREQGVAEQNQLMHSL